MADLIAEVVVDLVPVVLAIALVVVPAYLLFSTLFDAAENAGSRSRGLGWVNRWLAPLRMQRWLALLVGIAWNFSITTGPKSFKNPSPFWVEATLYLGSFLNSFRNRLPFWADATVYLGSLLVVFALLSRSALSGRIGMIFLFACGCAIGIVIDAYIDFNYSGVDRNLFPFEIAFSWIVMTPFAIVGTVVGWCFRRRIELAS